MKKSVKSAFADSIILSPYSEKTFSEIIHLKHFFSEEEIALNAPAYDSPFGCTSQQKLGSCLQDKFHFYLKPSISFNKLFIVQSIPNSFLLLSEQDWMPNSNIIKEKIDKTNKELYFIKNLSLNYFDFSYSELIKHLKENIECFEQSFEKTFIIDLSILKEIYNYLLSKKNLFNSTQEEHKIDCSKVIAHTLKLLCHKIMLTTYMKQLNYLNSFTGNNYNYSLTSFENFDLVSLNSFNEKKPKTNCFPKLDNDVLSSYDKSLENISKSISTKYEHYISSHDFPIFSNKEFYELLNIEEIEQEIQSKITQLKECFKKAKNSSSLHFLNIPLKQQFNIAEKFLFAINNPLASKALTFLKIELTFLHLANFYKITQPIMDKDRNSLIFPTLINFKYNFFSLKYFTCFENVYFIYENFKKLIEYYEHFIHLEKEFDWDFYDLSFYQEQLSEFKNYLKNLPGFSEHFTQQEITTMAHKHSYSNFHFSKFFNTEDENKIEYDSTFRPTLFDLQPISANKQHGYVIQQLEPFFQLIY